MNQLRVYVVELKKYLIVKEYFNIFFSLCIELFKIY